MEMTDLINLLEAERKKMTAEGIEAGPTVGELFDPVLYASFEAHHAEGTVDETIATMLETMFRMFLDPDICGAINAITGITPTIMLGIANDLLVTAGWLRGVNAGGHDDLNREVTAMADEYFGLFSAKLNQVLESQRANIERLVAKVKEVAQEAQMKVNADREVEKVGPSPYL